MPLETTTDQPFLSMTRQMTKLMDQLQKGYYSFYPGETWMPQVNLYENETAYLVCVDLAGVEKEKIDLHLVGHQLILKGSRPVPIHKPSPEAQGQPEKVRVHLMEIDHGSFVREVELPRDVSQDRISAEYRNGLLWIELPKK